MTTLREAAQQALEALEYYRSGEDYQPTPASDAVVALREALAAQDKQDETRDNLERYTQEVRNIMARKPLTDEEITVLVLEWWCPTMVTAKDRKFVRAIERAHGIGSEE